MVLTVAHTPQELKLSMPPMGWCTPCHTSTYTQEFMDNSLPTKSSSVTGTENDSDLVLGMLAEVVTGSLFWVF